jgi:hypothetical protein
MTKFKELKRIERAIEHKNEAELRWALDYCRMRIKLASTVHTMRKQGKYWHQMESKVRDALENPDRRTAITAGTGNAACAGVG